MQKISIPIVSLSVDGVYTNSCILELVGKKKDIQHIEAYCIMSETFQ